MLLTGRSAYRCDGWGQKPLTTMKSPPEASPAAAATDTHSKSSNWHPGFGMKVTWVKVWLPDHSSESGLAGGSESCLNPAWLCAFFKKTPKTPLSKKSDFRRKCPTLTDNVEYEVGRRHYPVCDSILMQVSEVWRARFRCHVRTRLSLSLSVHVQLPTGGLPDETCNNCRLLHLSSQLLNHLSSFFFFAQLRGRNMIRITAGAKSCWMRDSLQFCRLCDSVLGWMLARDLSFITAL